MFIDAHKYLRMKGRSDSMDREYFTHASMWCPKCDKKIEYRDPDDMKVVVDKDGASCYAVVCPHCGEVTPLYRVHPEYV